MKMNIGNDDVISGTDEIKIYMFLLGRRTGFIE